MKTNIPDDSDGQQDGADKERESSPPADSNLVPNPFDPESLRLSQDYASSIGVKKIVTTVPCRKPNRHEFVQVRPGEEWRLETGLFEDKIQREVYLVERHLWPELAGDVHAACLFLAVNRQKNLILWPVKLPGPDGRSNHWNESALAAAVAAQSNWIRVASNLSGGMYDTFEASGELPPPEWPDLSFREILRLCFLDRFIQDLDHPIVRSLRGEV